MRSIDFDFDFCGLVLLYKDLIFIGSVFQILQFSAVASIGRTSVKLIQHLFVRVRLLIFDA